MTNTSDEAESACSEWRSFGTTLYLKPTLLVKRQRWYSQQPWWSAYASSSIAARGAVIVWVMGISLGLHPLWVVLCLRALPSSLDNDAGLVMTAVDLWKRWILDKSHQVAATGVVWFLALCFAYVAVAIRSGQGRHRDHDNNRKTKQS